MSILIELPKILRSATKKHGVPGASVAVLRGKRIVATAAAGVINLDTQVPTTADTIFQIGSITKPLTATLVMQLRDEGVLDLDTPVVEYLPEFRVADPLVWRAVTPRHFLSHTSGIDGDFFPDAGRGDDCIRRFVDMCAMLPSLFPPETMMSYCNVGYAVLGRVIEVLTGQTYDEALRKRIFAPLGMNHSISLPEDTLRFRTAIGHVPDPKKKGQLIVAPSSFLSFGQKAAGSTPMMTASDLLRFAYVHLNSGSSMKGSRLLSASSTRMMQRQQIGLPRNSRPGYTGWGLGWGLNDWGGHKVFGHNGATIGQASFLRISPEKKLAVALLTNGGDPPALYSEIFDNLFGSLAGFTEPAPPAPDDDIEPQVGSLAGTYEDSFRKFEISEHRGRVVVSVHFKQETRRNMSRVPLAFVDKNTAVMKTNDPVTDGMVLHFSGYLEDGRAGYLASFGRQKKRTS